MSKLFLAALVRGYQRSRFRRVCTQPVNGLSCSQRGLALAQEAGLRAVPALIQLSTDCFHEHHER